MKKRADPIYVFTSKSLLESMRIEATPLRVRLSLWSPLRKRVTFTMAPDYAQRVAQILAQAALSAKEDQQ